MVTSVTVADLKRRLYGDGEVALVDVREPGESGEGRPLLAVNVPFSVLEARAPAMLPSPRTPIVLMDDGGGDMRAASAAQCLERLGYRDTAVLDGGLAAWTQAGATVFKGVNVPSKTFGELLEHARHTPSISAEELAALCEGEQPPVILDGRTPAEHTRMSIPGGISCPNGELGLRVLSLSGVGDTVVVNCAGRTRSIVGAQTLIDLGVRDQVVALRNGTMGWRLAGYELDHDTGLTHSLEVAPDDLETVRARAHELASADGVEAIAGTAVDRLLDADERAVYLLDVRTRAEFDAGHQPGAVHAPGGQLVQATDHWIAARGALVVLIDDEGVRAPLTARWLRCMGHDARVLTPGDSLRDRAPAVTWRAPDLARIDAARLPANALLVDVRASERYGDAHVDGAVWSIRPRLGLLEPGSPVVLVADDADVAALAATELESGGHAVAGWLSGDEAAWRAAGLTVVTDQRVPDEERIDYLFFVHDRHHGNMDAAREYLAWETGLTGQLDQDERALFRL